MLNYLRLQVQNLIKETNDTTSILLKNINSKSVNFQPGQFLTFFLNVNGDEKKYFFSITSLPEELPLIRITVKEKLNNSSDNFIERIKIGDIIKTLPPPGNFTLSNRKYIKNNLIFFGAGSGITPLFPMIKFALTKNIADNIFLYYGNHNESSVIFHNEFNKLKNTFNGKLKVVNYLSQPKYLNNCIKGRITKNETINQLNQLDSQIISDADFFVCGPEGMMKNVIEGLEEFKISSNNIHTENFSFGILDYDEEIELIEREVTILISGEQHKIKIEAGNTILQQALQEKIHIPNSCNYGSCGTCKAKLISGKIMLAAHTALSHEEREKGFCLTCIGYPVSENIVILYENPFED